MELTGYLDEQIGFKSDDYVSDKIVSKFFTKFIGLADEEWEKINEAELENEE